MLNGKSKFIFIKKLNNMGIKNLNRFLRTECKDSIKLISLKELSGKKIVIDISIYLFKYAADNCLIENIYLMLSIFRYYNIIPIFVFDGKTPNEKKELIEKRKENKLEAENEYKILKNKLEETNELDEIEKQEIINNMDLLKRKFVTIKKNDFDNVKKIIIAYGASYYDAVGEADELCALLTIKGKVWACLSEDMDMFVYGCPRVIRYLSLLNHTTVLYEQKGILENLGVTQKELREICVISGTDYNIYNNDITNKNSPTLYNTLKYFKKYKKNEKHEKKIDFYDWLIEKTNYIEDYKLLQKINKIFDINYTNEQVKNFEKTKIINGQIIYSDIREILKTDGFIFPEKIKVI
jgi:5'-3' exonuclease